MTYLAQVLADNPLHYWRCADPGGGLLHDIAPSPTHMHSLGNPTLGYSGPNSDGGCVDLVLDATYANTQQNVAFPGGACSMELLVWPMGNLAVTAQLAQWTSAPQVAIYHDNTQHLGFIYNNTAALDPAVFASQAWHHVVGTYDGVNAKVYVDRALKATIAVAAQAPQNNILELGTNAALSVYSRSFFSEVAIYGAALSLARVQAHYDAIDQLASSPVFQQFGLYSSGSGSTTPLGTDVAAILAAVRKTWP